MAQHDAGGTGATQASGPSRNPTEAWSVGGLGGGITPVVSGTTTYANTYALRTTNRDGIWTAEMDTPPTVTGTTLYTTRRESVVALDRSDASEQWSWSPDYSPDLALSRPVLYDGSLYVACKTDGDEGDLYALDAEDGTREWKYNLFLGDPMAPPAVSEDRVFVSADRGVDERKLRAYDRSDGSHLWDQPEGATSRQPSYRDGIVYTASAEAIDATTGAVRWSFDFGDEEEYGNSVAVSADTVVAVGTYGDDEESDPSVYGLGRDGTQQWSYEISETDTAPAIADGVAYVGPTDEGVVYALDTTSGEELWSYDLGAGGTGTSLAVANDVLYVPTGDGTLYAITEGENEPPDPSIEYYPPDPVVGEPVSFDGTGSTDDTGITDFAWTVTGPSTYEATGPRTSTTLTEPGEYEVTLSVTDDNGTSASADESFTVRPEPTATETETEVDEETTTESGETTTRGDETATESDEAPTDASATTTTASSSDGSAGDVSAAFTFRPTGPPVGETVEFDASPSETPAEEIVAYEWDFDNGETAAGQQVSETFGEVGHFFVELTVTDSDGNTARTEQEVRTVRGDGAGASGPGFGLTSALASLGGVGYLLKRRFDDE